MSETPQKEQKSKFAGLANLVFRSKKKSKEAKDMAGKTERELPVSHGPGNITARGVVIQMEPEDEVSLDGSSRGESPKPTVAIPDYNKMLAERRAKVLLSMREGIDTIIVEENDDVTRKTQEKQERERIRRDLERLRNRPSASDQDIKAAQEQMKRERQKTMPQRDLSLADLLEMSYQEESDFLDIKLNLIAQRLKQNNKKKRSDTRKVQEKANENPKKAEDSRGPTRKVQPGYTSENSAETERRLPDRPKEIRDRDIADYVEALENVVQSDIKTLLNSSDGLKGKGKKAKSDKKTDADDALPTVEN